MPHDQDEDCLPHLDANSECTICGVGMPDSACENCGGRAYHRHGCVTPDEGCDD
jgi:hypothetical protein